MKKSYYFRHDASASGNQKLMLLMEQEGVKGYGLYWLLLESLFRQPQMSAPLSLLRGLAYRFRTKESVLRRVVECYNLFEVKDGMFSSPGLDRRMRPLVAAQEAYDRSLLARQESDKSLINSDDLVDNAHIEEKSIKEKSREEKNSSSRREEEESAAATAVVDL